MRQAAKEYAQALFLLGKEEQKTEEYAHFLSVLSDLIDEAPEYLELLSSPALTVSERTALIDEAFVHTFPEYLVSFLKILCENGYFRMLPDCIREFENLRMESANQVQAIFSCAIPLTEEQKEKLQNKLEKRLGKQIAPVFVIDESLIGGVKIQIEGTTYDGSLKQQLHEIKEVMIR